MPNNNPTGINQYTKGGRGTSFANKINPRSKKQGYVGTIENSGRAKPVGKDVTVRIMDTSS